MINLSTRQIKIVNELFKQKYTKLETLTKNMHISQNTLVSEISCINYVFSNSDTPLSITNQHSKGYLIECEDDSDMLEIVRRHCTSYLNLFIHYYFSNHDRILWLIRYLLQIRGSIKSENIITIMNVSLATLNKDLRVVRKVFNAYHIKIVSVPYKGMHLEGSVSAKRSCLIDFCDLYNSKELDILPQRFIDELQINEEDIGIINDKLLMISNKHQIQLTDIGYNRVLLYLVLYKNNVFQKESLDVGLDYLIDTKYFQLAKDLLPKNHPIKETILLTLFLLVNIETECLDDELIYNSMPSIFDINNQILFKLKEISGLDMTDWQEFNDYFIKILYVLYIKNEYGLYNYMTPFKTRKYLRKMISSYSITNYIYHILNNKEIKFPRHEYSFYELALSIYSLIYKLKNKYNKTKIGIIGGAGKSSYEVFEKRILGIMDFDIEVSKCYEYQLDTIEDLGYDGLIFSEALEIDTSKINIPVLSTENYTQGGVWDKVISKKRIVKILRPYLDSAVETNLKIESNKIEDTIIKTFLDNGIELLEDKQSCKELLYSLINDGIYDSTSEIKIINIFTTQQIENRYFVFNLFKPIKKDQGKIVMLHFLFMDSSHGPIIIKNGDSELRRYFNL